MNLNEISIAGQEVTPGTSEAQPIVEQDIAQGVPVPIGDTRTPSYTPVPAPQADPNAPQSPGGPEAPKPASEDVEKLTERLRQQNAQQAKLLSSLGIDPLSDIAEQLENGLITEEQIRNHVMNKYQPREQNNQYQQAPQVNMNDPVQIAEKELQDAEAAFADELEKEKSVSIETNNRVRMADKKLYDAKLNNVINRVDAKEEQAQINVRVEAVKDVARKGPDYANMDQNLQLSSEILHVSLTGTLANKWAIDSNMDPAAITTQQYQYFANEAAKTLAPIADYYRNLGREEAKAQFNPRPNPNLPPGVRNAMPGNMPRNNNANMSPMPQIVAPINAGGDPVPIANPYGGANIANHKDMARQYATRAIPRL